VLCSNSANARITDRSSVLMAESSPFQEDAAMEHCACAMSAFISCSFSSSSHIVPGGSHHVTVVWQRLLLSAANEVVDFYDARLQNRFFTIPVKGDSHAPRIVPRLLRARRAGVHREKWADLYSVFLCALWTTSKARQQGWRLGSVEPCGRSRRRKRLMPGSEKWQQLGN
jgi:hypothetical protein